MKRDIADDDDAGEEQTISSSPMARKRPKRDG